MLRVPAPSVLNLMSASGRPEAAFEVSPGMGTAINRKRVAKDAREINRYVSAGRLGLMV